MSAAPESLTPSLVRSSAAEYLTFVAATIAVGYKVNSERAVQFRKWATEMSSGFTQFSPGEARSGRRGFGSCHYPALSALTDPMSDERLLLQIKDAPFDRPVMSTFASEGAHP